MMTAVTACAPWAPTRDDSRPARDDPGAAGLVARARGATSGRGTPWWSGTPR
jgi:hypothetical protein